MTLRKKTVIILGLVIIGLVGAYYAITQTVLRSNFDDLEDYFSLQYAQRAQLYFEDETQKLAALTANWATWDEIYEYAARPTDAFIDANLAGASFEGADVGGVFFDGANLTGANLATADCSGTSFQNANLTNANCHNTDLIAANLTGAEQAGLNLEGAVTTDARGIQV